MAATTNDPFRDGDHQELLNRPPQREREQHARKVGFVRFAAPSALLFSILGFAAAVHIFLSPPRLATCSWPSWANDPGR